MTDQTSDARLGARRKFGVRADALLTAAGTRAVHLRNVAGVFLAVASTIGVIAWAFVPGISSAIWAKGKWLVELPLRIAGPPPRCHKDASGMLPKMIEHGLNYPARDWDLEALFKATFWGEHRCIVAEVHTQPEPKSEGGFRAILLTKMWVEREVAPVRLHAHMRELQPLQKGTFVAVSGVLRKFEEADKSLDLHMHDSTFPDRWSEVDPSETEPTPPR